jgi:hypothetical protein
MGFYQVKCFVMSEGGATYRAAWEVLELRGCEERETGDEIRMEEYACHCTGNCVGQTAEGENARCLGDEAEISTGVASRSTP